MRMCLQRVKSKGIIRMNKRLRRFFADAKAIGYRLSLIEIELIELEQEQRETALKFYNLFRPMVVDSIPMIEEQEHNTHENIQESEN